MRTISTGIAELDLLLGGGVVPGMVVLITGPCGIGKTTLMLQAAAGVVRNGGRVVYDGRDQPVAEYEHTIERLGLSKDGITIVDSELHLPINQVIDRCYGGTRASLLIIDTLNQAYSLESDEKIGSQAQLNAVIKEITDFNDQDRQKVEVPMLAGDLIGADGVLLVLFRADKLTIEPPADRAHGLYLVDGGAECSPISEPGIHASFLDPDAKWIHMAAVVNGIDIPASDTQAPILLRYEASIAGTRMAITVENRGATTVRCKGVLSGRYL